MTSLQTNRSKATTLHKFVRWGGTVTYMIGMVLTSLNIYPLNLMFCLLGGTMWAWAGVIYKDRALILVEVMSALIYLFGIVLWSFK